jgi:hypothetical protein
MSVAAVGYPVYAGRAHDLVLEQNQRTLAQQVRCLLAADADPAFAPSDPDDAEQPATTVSTQLARLIGGDAGRFVNPQSASQAVVCAHSLPAASAQPAVRITDSPHFAHAAGVKAGKLYPSLAGSLIVVFSAGSNGGGAIDVYFVSRGGWRRLRSRDSPTEALSIPTQGPPCSEIALDTRLDRKGMDLVLVLG